MLAYILSKLVTLTYGLMYPAYCSFKAVKTKDVREYVNWMMYWIAFALFSVVEVFADTFVGCWFPFYYEGKIIFLLWMISSSTRGGAVMYRRYIHPALLRHEEEIDACLADFKAKASNALMKWGYRVLTSATDFVMSAAFRHNAEPIMDNFRRTYSMNDISRTYGQRYLGPPAAPADPMNILGPRYPSDIYFDRNVPAQAYGDVHMGDGNEGNVDRSPTVSNSDMEQADIADNRRLRSSTRKRHVEPGLAGAVDGLARDGPPLHYFYGWYPGSSSSSPASSILFPPNFDPLAFQMELFNNPQLYEQRRSLVITEEPAEMETSDCDEFFDCDHDTAAQSQKAGTESSETNSVKSVSTTPATKTAKAVVKTVAKTKLQAFDPSAEVDSKVQVPTNVGANVTRTAQALVGNTLQVASSVTTPTMATELRQKGANVATTVDALYNKKGIKHSSSFGGVEDKHIKPHLSWHSSSFRRVFNPFSSPKSVPPIPPILSKPSANVTSSSDSSTKIDRSTSEKKSE